MKSGYLKKGMADFIADGGVCPAANSVSASLAVPSRVSEMPSRLPEKPWLASWQAALEVKLDWKAGACGQSVGSIGKYCPTEHLLRR